MSDMEKENRLTIALSLSEEIIKNVESNEIPVEDMCLKAVRLAMMLDESKTVESFMDASSNVKTLKSHINSFRSIAVLVPRKAVHAHRMAA